MIILIKNETFIFCLTKSKMQKWGMAEIYQGVISQIIPCKVSQQTVFILHFLLQNSTILAECSWIAYRMVLESACIHTVTFSKIFFSEIPWPTKAIFLSTQALRDWLSFVHTDEPYNKLLIALLAPCTLCISGFLTLNTERVQYFSTLLW